MYNSTKRMVDFYEYWYGRTIGFIRPDYMKIYLWDGFDQLPLISKTDVLDMFNHPMFYTKENIMEGAYETLLEMENSGKFELIVVSIGTSENISNKTMFLNENFPFIKKHIMLINNGSEIKMDKSILNGFAVLLDDNQDNLTSSNTTFSICFANQGLKDWNKDWIINGCSTSYSWTEFKTQAYRIYKRCIEV